MLILMVIRLTNAIVDRCITVYSTGERKREASSLAQRCGPKDRKRQTLTTPSELNTDLRIKTLGNSDFGMGDYPYTEFR